MNGSGVGRPRPARLEARRAAVRAEGHAVAAEQRVRFDGPTRLHLVLESGACYRIHIIADVGPVAIRWLDEHGHRVAQAAGRGGTSAGGVEGVCPRWSGSFQLLLTGPSGTDATVVLERW